MAGEASARNLVLLYEVMLATAVKQKEAVARHDMAQFEREAGVRDNLANQVDEIMPHVMAMGAAAEARIREVQALARRILEVDAETRAEIEKASIELAGKLSGIENERQCMAAYGSVIGFDGRETGFVDKMK